MIGARTRRVVSDEIPSNSTRTQYSPEPATPAPPVGPALGQHGLNIMNFCKEYNARTADKGDLIIPVEISAYEDRSFSFVLKTPLAVSSTLIFFQYVLEMTPLPDMKLPTKNLDKSKR